MRKTPADRQTNRGGTEKRPKEKARQGCLPGETRLFFVRFSLPQSGPSRSHAQPEASATALRTMPLVWLLSVLGAGFEPATSRL